ncbi:Gfo/Idh/MocA family oxidoreductase [Streptomyces sp. AcE210]|uniref:Gfo/Idh/MocA family protein n=1 Tax=Streptomyces sp. AcE210 TaxID=2292703 RepID=UPI000E305FCB|nr:Gfo/Idh/MocA family oxidoreductase [Streptomyces sp. AcE210]RFC70823.1 gfo/Idh/MocA family oxidoreductase [Streptomyces sp. AcE210]
MTTPHPRSAIVGTGMIGAVHARAVRAAGGVLHGVLGSSPARSTQAAAALDAPHAYPDLDALLADDAVDVVHLCTPNTLHARQALDVLGAGKHLVCEKPLATSAADAERVVAAARAADRLVAVPFVYRYHPMVREIRARRQAGEFGNWQLLHGSYLQDWMLPADTATWRADPAAGGPSRAFADIGSHWCDLVEWTAGVEFTEVTARLATTVAQRPVGSTASFGGPERQGTGPVECVAVSTEDVAVLLLRTGDGTLANLTVSQVSAGRKNRLWFELDGSNASAVFDQEEPERAWLGGLDGARILVRDPGRGSAEQRRLAHLPAGHAQGYADCFTSFTRDVHQAVAGEGLPDGLPTATDGLRSAQLVEAVLTSAAAGVWTDVSRRALAAA